MTAGRPEEDHMPVQDDATRVVSASLRTLIDPPTSNVATSPRDLLVSVSSAWADDARAWQLARQLIPEAESYLARIEQEIAAQPDDPALARLRARIRYAHVVALALYRQLRVAGRRTANPL
jgi:hypothetical protein